MLIRVFLVVAFLMVSNRFCKPLLNIVLVSRLLPLAIAIVMVATKAVYADTDESIFFTEMPTVVSATRIHQSRLEVPVSVTIIDRAMIEASGFNEVVDLLRLVPGFQVAHSDGRLLTGTYHGLSSQFSARLQVLIDGRSLYHAMLSTVDWTALGIHMDDIEKIEVIRGPNAPAYGANAFVGTVNIITRQPFVDHGREASLQFGSLQHRAITARDAGHYGGFHYRLRANYREDNGFDDLDDQRALSGLSLRGNFSLSAHDEIDISLGIDHGTTGSGGDLEAVTIGSGDTVVLDSERDRDLTSHHKHIRWRRATSPDRDFTVQFYHNYYRQRDITALPAPLSDIVGATPAQVAAFFNQPDQVLRLARYQGTSERFDLDIQNLWVTGSGHRLSWGGGLRQDILESDVHLGPDERAEDISGRLFFNGEFRLTSATTMNMGLMAEHGQIVGGQFSPRLALNWLFAENQVVRLSATRAYRNPSLLEANWNYGIRFADGTIADQLFITNDNVDSERITSYEIGLVGEHPKPALSWEIKLFREEIDDGIASAGDDSFVDPLGQVLPISQGARVEGNFDDAIVKGIEGQLIYRPSKRSFIALQYSYSDAKLRSLINLSPFRQALRGYPVPRHTASVLMNKGFADELDASMGIYHTGKVKWLADGDLVPAYTRVDVRLAKKFTIEHHTIKLTIGIQNLFNEYQEFFRAVDSPEKRRYIELTWSGF